LKVVIVSDPLVQRGGAERVVEALAEAFPDAPVYTLLYDAETGPASLAPRIQTSWLNQVPMATKKHRLFLPLYRNAIESLDVSQFDVIISSHHSVAKGVLTRSDQLHVCYCHTPMRALWERPHAELATLSKAARPMAASVLSHLRTWDAVSANRVQKFVANSSETQRRIATYYRRDSDIIFPPIDTERFTPAGVTGGDYYLVASRPVPYKRVDLAVEAVSALGRRVKIVGGKHPLSPQRNVELLGHVSDSELQGLMRGTRALLFPQFEDFGMTPLEVNACGRPVVAYGAGGAVDTVIDGVTGVLAASQDVPSFVSAMRRLEATKFNAHGLRNHALQFSRDRFISEMQAYVGQAWDEHRLTRRRRRPAA
jgi:glycosyltransferase involved in cell wall biosynthesis